MRALTLTVLASLVALYGVLVGVILGLPFLVGVGLQVVFSAVTDKKGWLAVPAILGALWAVGYVVWLWGLVPLWFWAVYWAVFFLCLFLTRLLVGLLRRLVLKWMGRT